MSNERTSVLVVDDEPRIRSFLEENLRSDDFDVVVAGSVAQARSKLQSSRPAVVLLDVMLPDASGFDLCRDIRAEDPLLSGINPDVPIIMLTARGDEVDRVRGFDRGADDYVLKPFHYPELLGRVRALLRRSTDAARKEITDVAGVSVQMEEREVRVHGYRVDLSAKEFDLLVTLLRDPRRVFKKQELLEEVWGYRAMGATRTLDSHASRLRRKMRPYAQGRDYIANVWGVGYRLVGNEPLDR